MKLFPFFFLTFSYLVSTVVQAHAGIDFTLRTKQENAGAPDPEHRFITDGENHIYLRIPKGWKDSGGGSQLVFTPEQPSSEVSINQVLGIQALPLDATGLAALRQGAQTAVPQGAKDIKPTGETNDLLPIFGWKSYEATFEYDFYGQQMRRSVLYINMIPGRVVRVNVTALASDFDQVHEKMRKLMFGWFEPKRDLPPQEARDYEEGGFKGS